MGSFCLICMILMSKSGGLSPPRRRVGRAGSRCSWMGNSRLRPLQGFSSRGRPRRRRNRAIMSCSWIKCVTRSSHDCHMIIIHEQNFAIRFLQERKICVIRKKCIMHVFGVHTRVAEWIMHVCTRTSGSVMKAHESLHISTTKFVISSFDSSFTTYQYWK